MAVHAPFRLLLVRRLVSICTSSQRHSGPEDGLVKLSTSRRQTRTFSTAAVKRNDNEGDTSDSSPPSTELTFRQALLSKRRRPLSPLERISGLLPRDALSAEVTQLREQDQTEPGEDANTRAEEPNTSACHQEERPPLSTLPRERPPLSTLPRERPPLSTLPGESLLTFGELLVAECRRRRVEFRKMFQLQAGGRLQSSWGIVLHEDMVGQHAGRFLKTSMGVSIFIRRPSLEDYVLYMKRGPAIAYPKDAATMLMMMDVTEGDSVLESGSGSGAMSLFLSRAVGSKGSVLSVEIREDHHRRAALNYQRWRSSWRLRRGEEWPDNVQFHRADLGAASPLLAGRGLHAVALDMINPQMVLPNVIPHLHPGAVCAVYLANITQVIDLLEGLRCSALPLLCERIIEVPVRVWAVGPALQKDGRYRTRMAPIQDADLRRGDETSDDTGREETTTEEVPVPVPAFGSIPYMARPHCDQMSHTAFLVKLRKCVR
ncbi:tRNA (adenine(58)-N(1))-methyltransferase, mitochondrial isoform X1 [Embiotoca jacksoni]|uniref:tRNA (adenine(58)-N(1))-methyltransferase, mitochondrial isoform X1 n=1 Tax=Embiotoca jacksoni TaxID=100190 RepID=UPI00370428EB